MVMRSLEMNNRAPLVTPVHPTMQSDFTEKYWHMKRLGLGMGVDEGHGVPFELPSYQHKYYHPNPSQESAQELRHSLAPERKRLPSSYNHLLDKSDRSVTGGGGGGRSASGEQALTPSFSPDPLVPLLATPLSQQDACTRGASTLMEKR